MITVRLVIADGPSVTTRAVGAYEAGRRIDASASTRIGAPRPVGPGTTAAGWPGNDRVVASEPLPVAPGTAP